jgi:hypothetical protein
MGDDDAEVVDDQQVNCSSLDVGGGSECFQLGEDWVRYLATAELPENMTGVDTSIADFDTEGPAVA